MREQMNERRGMKLIGIGSRPRRDALITPLDCGCGYVEISTLSDPRPTYLLHPPYCDEHSCGEK